MGAEFTPATSSGSRPRRTRSTEPISGITNAGLFRPAPFTAGPEKCVAEGILTGRLCGVVVKTLNPELNGAQVVATYRLHTATTAKGEIGPAVAGTLEGVLITAC